MAEYPATDFRLDGEPASVRSSAALWSSFGSEASSAAGQIRSLDTSLFIGPEGDSYRQGLNESLPPHLETTGQAYSKVAMALDTFAGALSGLQTRMSPLAVQAPGLWAAVQSAQGRVGTAESADSAHTKTAKATAAALKPGQTAPVDTYHSDAGAASGALSAAQQAWDDCHTAALKVKTDLGTAVDACVRDIKDAAGMRFHQNPHGWGAFTAGFKSFVKDHVAGLAKLSGVLKTISAVAGVLSFVPVIGEIAAPIAVATGAAALAIDASIKYATGQGSWKSIIVDGALMALPGVGKLASKGVSAMRGVKAGETAVEDTRAVAGAADIPAPHAGQDVWRVYGGQHDAAGNVIQGEGKAGELYSKGSGPYGKSWTPKDPDLSPNFRSDAGLPDENPARFVIKGTLKDPSAVSEVRPALPLDGNPGGWPEYVIENSGDAVEVTGVSGVNEAYTSGPGQWTP